MTKHFRTFSFVHHIFAEMSGRFGKIIQQRSENTAETANYTEARSKCIESPVQTHRKLGANASKARSKRIESSEQTHRKPGANDTKARSKLDNKNLSLFKVGFLYELGP